MLRDPRIEVHVHGAVATFEDALAARLLQLALEHTEAAVGLGFVAGERIVVGLGVVVAEPVRSV